MLDALGTRVDAVTWLGRAGGLEERLMADRGIRFRAVASGPIIGSGPLRALASAGRMVAGTFDALRAMRAGAPDVLMVTGGYVSVPAALAARLAGIPLAIYLPDVRPGRAVAAIARLADRILVTDAASLAYLPDRRAMATGYPVRALVRDADRDAARARLGIAPGTRLLLVFGGSQGARRLNEAVPDAADRLAEQCAILHVAGPRGIEDARARHASLAADTQTGYRVTSYLDGAAMADALAAADLVVCRAGASVLGELPARGLPAILVPLPISGGHQWPNAHVLEAAGAAVVVADDALDGDRLFAEVDMLMRAPERLAAMGRAAARLDVPEAAETIGRALLDLAGAGA